MSALTRTAIGPFCLPDAVDPQQLTADNLPGHLLPMSAMVQTLPQVVLSADDIGRIRNGLTIPRKPSTPEAEEIAALDAEGRLVAILRPRSPELWGPLRNLPTD